MYSSCIFLSIHVEYVVFLLVYVVLFLQWGVFTFLLHTGKNICLWRLSIFCYSFPVANESAFLSQLLDRFRNFGQNRSGRRTATCALDIHPDGTCACRSTLRAEDSGTRARISRIVMLAEALFEVVLS